MIDKTTFRYTRDGVTWEVPMYRYDAQQKYVAVIVVMEGNFIGESARSFDEAEQRCVIQLETVPSWKLVDLVGVPDEELLTDYFAALRAAIHALTFDDTLILSYLATDGVVRPSVLPIEQQCQQMEQRGLVKPVDDGRQIQYVLSSLGERLLDYIVRFGISKILEGRES